MRWSNVYAALQTLVAATSAPALDAAALEQLIYQAQRVDAYGRGPGGPLVPWQAGHAYATGVRVRAAAIDSDHAYEVTTAGTTGSGAPTWPADLGATVTDGTVTWQEVWVGTWSLAAAARDGWRFKATQVAAGGGSLAIGDVRVDRAGQVKSYLDLAAYYARQANATITLPGACERADVWPYADVLGNA